MTPKELILASLMRAMIKYDGGDAPRRQKESAGSLLIIILIRM